MDRELGIHLLVKKVDSEKRLSLSDFPDDADKPKEFIGPKSIDQSFFWEMGQLIAGNRVSYNEANIVFIHV